MSNMALGVPEALLLFGAAMLLFGPEKVPEIARSIGKAMREYKKGLQGVTKDIQNQALLDETEPTSEEDSLIQTAKKLGIPTEGRPIEDIAQDIIDKTA